MAINAVPDAMRHETHDLDSTVQCTPVYCTVFAITVSGHRLLRLHLQVMEISRLLVREESALMQIHCIGDA